VTAVENPPKSTGSRRRHSEITPTAATSGPLWRQYLRAIGPGLVTGASDDDPSGIATYSQAGAKFGFGFLWAALLTLPLMATVQEICDRTALATGAGLGELAVKRFHRAGRTAVAVLVAALIVANALNVSADLVAVGNGMNLLHAGPAALWAAIAGVAITTVLMVGSFGRIALVFKILCAALLSYIVVMFTVTGNWGSVASHTFIPHLSLTREYLALLVAVLGTTISPYLFFWQSAHRLEELRDEPEGGNKAVRLKDQPPEKARRKQRTSRLDVFTGMTFSNLVMFAIIAVTAQTIHGQDIQSASQAAQALKPVAGHWAATLFALGFIGSGLLAIPVLAGAGSVGMAGLLGKKWGFSRSLRKAPVFYGLVALGTVGGTILSAAHINPIKLLVLVAVTNGVAAAPFLIVVMCVSGSRSLMGDQVNGKAAKVIGWTTTAVMAVAAVAMFATGGVSL
jgi:NRAMP (natural resistance-associated macrophage protein)-like metal ion transporter